MTFAAESAFGVGTSIEIFAQKGFVSLLVSVQSKRHILESKIEEVATVGRCRRLCHCFFCDDDDGD